MKALPQPRLIFVIPEDWFFWSHRRAVALAAQAAGFEVVVATRVGKHGQLIQAEGFRLIPIRLRRKSRNPLNELLAINELVSIYKRERPAIVNHLTIKPVLYGSLAARLAGVENVVNSVTGLGHMFVARGWRASLVRGIVRLAYRAALNINARRSRVIFENSEDRDTFVNSGIIGTHQSVVIRGMGCNMNEFLPSPEPGGVPIVMLAARLLWNKGVGELVEAVGMLHARGVKCRLVLVGVPDSENPMSIPEDMLRRWQSEGKAEWWGRREDMAGVLAQSTLVVLPTTYGEGLPKILIEGAASARALIATDIPGCREIVRHNENGLLVPPKAPEALAEAIGTLLRDPELRARMATRSREIAVGEFSDEQVNRETLAVYRDLLGEGMPQSG